MSRKINYTTVPTDWLVWEYLLDWDANDTSGNWNDGTATDITWNSATKGYVTEVASFNGTSSRIDFSSNPFDSFMDWNSDFSIAWWFNADNISATNEYYIFNNFPNKYVIKIRDWSLQTKARISNTSYKTTFSLSTWQWYFFVATYSSSNWQKLYINWSLVGSDSNTWSFDNASWWVTRIGEGDQNRWKYFNWLIWIFRVYNKILTDYERNNLYQEWERRIGIIRPKDTGFNFPKYSLPNLEEGKVLEISRAQSGGVYYDQTGSWNDSTSVTNVTDSTVGQNNVMTFSSWSISWNSVSFSTSFCWEKVNWVRKPQINPSYITSTWTNTISKELANIQLWNRTLSSTEERQLRYAQFIW